MKLAGVTDIGAMLGVTKQRAAQLVERDGFPEPLDRIASGRVWDRETIEKWAKAQGRKVAK